VGVGLDGSRFAIAPHGTQAGFTQQPLDDHGRYVAAAIAPVVDNQGFLIQLRVKVTGKLVEAFRTHIGDMYVPDTAIACRGNFRDVLLHPFMVIKCRLITNGLYQYFARSVIRRSSVDFNLYQLVRLTDEGLIDVIHFFHRRAVNGDDVFTRFGIYTRCAQRRYQLLVPALAGEYAVNTVVTIRVTA